MRQLPLLSTLRLLAAAAATLAASWLPAQTGFTTRIYPVPYPGLSLLAADFNHDGKPDLLSFGGYYNVSGPIGSVFLNDGNGGFLTPIPLPGDFSTGLTNVHVGDLNGDGIPDLVGCLYPASGDSVALVTYLNNGSGSFTLAQTVPLAYRCDDLALADVNHDGHLDVILPGVTFATQTVPLNNRLLTFYGSGHGTFNSPIVQPNLNLDDPTDTSGNYTGCVLLGLTAGDFYQDGQVSLILNSACDSSIIEVGTTTFAHGRGDGHFNVAPAALQAGFQSSGQVADLHHDGRLDAVFADSVGSRGDGSLAVFHNNGGGKFARQLVSANLPYEVFDYNSLVLDDFNHDGLHDIAATLYGQYYFADGLNQGLALSILAGTPGQAFTDSQHWLIGADRISNLATADFNQDGLPDLALFAITDTTRTASLMVYTNSPGTNSCAVPSTQNASVLCTPSAGAGLTSPFNVTAASNVVDFTLERLYLDSKPVFEGTAQSINTPLTAAPGNHTLVLVSYNSDGKAFTSSKSFTVLPSSPAGCAPPASGVSICAPTAGATVGSPVTLSAAAHTPTGTITALRAYVDNLPVLTVNNPTPSATFALNEPVSIAAGTHTLVVLGYLGGSEGTAAPLRKAETFTVSGAPPCLPSTAGVKICSPTASSTSPVTISAGARAPAGNLTAMRVYVDNVARALVENPAKTSTFTIRPGIAVAAGTHTLVVVGYTSTGSSVSASETLQVP